MENKILCCVFNHNANEKAVRWWTCLSPHFDTLILDSGSQPPCLHEGALNLDNLFYSGLMNKAYELLLQRDYRWLMIVTSDIEIDADNTARLISGMQDMIRTANVGLYQPSCALSLHGRALYQSVCHYTGRIRRVNFQEGWFHLVCREILDEVLPVDLSLNRLGWGIDLVFSHVARIRRMLVLVDDRVRVVHPKGTGYNRETAKAQMRNWQASIAGYTSPRHFLPLKDPIRYLDSAR
jgi:hypothetical protein